MLHFFVCSCLCNDYLVLEPFISLTRLSTGFYEEAIILLNKAIKGEKSEKGLYVNRGDCFFKEANLQFALADYHQALELAPNDRVIHKRIAIVHNEYGVHEYLEKKNKVSEILLHVRELGKK